MDTPRPLPATAPSSTRDRAGAARRLVALLALVAGGCQAYDHGGYERLIDGSVGCDGGLPTCGARCVDLVADPANCGRCGHACSSGQLCAGGACAESHPHDAATDDVAFDQRPDDAPDGGDDVAFDDTPAADVTLDAPVPDVPARDVPAADVPRDVPAPDVPVMLVPPVFRAVQTASIPAGTACCITVGRPAGSVAGDLLLAAVTLGVSGAMTLPVMTPPAGWTLVRRDDDGTTLSLWLFWHVATSAEPPSYVFATDHSTLGGVAAIMAYTGVDTASPIDGELGVDRPMASTMYAAPAITTSRPQSLLIIAIAGHGGTAATWTAPPGMTPRADFNDATTRSLLCAQDVRPMPGTTGARVATASMTLQYAVAASLGLAAAP